MVTSLLSFWPWLHLGSRRESWRIFGIIGKILPDSTNSHLFKMTTIKWKWKLIVMLWCLTICRMKSWIGKSEILSDQGLWSPKWTFFPVYRSLCWCDEKAFQHTDLKHLMDLPYGANFAITCNDSLYSGILMQSWTSRSWDANDLEKLYVICIMNVKSINNITFVKQKGKRGNKILILTLSISLQVYSHLEGNRSHVVNTGWAMLALIDAGQVKHKVSLQYLF